MLPKVAANLGKNHRFPRQRTAPGGRLFAVVGEAPVMKARLLRWTAPGKPVVTDVFETVVPALINAPQPERFTF